MNLESIVRRERDSQSGQSLVMVGLVLLILFAMAALAIDVGNMYYRYQQLMASTQAAALAGGQAMPNATGVATAKLYSGAAAGDYNVPGNLPGIAFSAVGLSKVTSTPAVECLTSTWLPPCVNYGEGLANAIVVQQQVTISTYFARLVGVPTITLTATATSSARGGSNGLYNVVMIVDSTDSMNTLDHGSNCNTTRFNCALGGVQTLMTLLTPCSLSSCNNTIKTASITDDVTLMTFPGLTPSSPGGSTSNYTPDDYTCGKTLPNNGATQPYNNGPVYTIVSNSTDFKSGNTGSTLNTSSTLVTAAAGGCSGGTNAMNVVGGQGTFYAGVIDAAQTQLVAEQTARTTAGVTSQNVMILISDGDATASGSQMGGTLSSYSATNQCLQAVTEAQKAAKAGTWVYAVAYGAESSGCATDKSPYNSPCYTMENIASSPGHIPDDTKFYSDYQQSGSGIDQTCIGKAQSTTNINQIFQDIGNDFTNARLISNNTP